MTLRELALFAGAGGGILGGLLLGWRTVCAVEIDSYARSVLLARQRDGILEPFPIWDDVCTFDGKPWRGHVDVISGGFPCQDISSAGKRAGIGGSRSGLWSEFARIIREVRPRYAFVENSSDLVIRGLGIVLGDLAAMGYDARWGVLSAAHVGAPHERARAWIVARNADGERKQPGQRRVRATESTRVPRVSTGHRWEPSEPHRRDHAKLCASPSALDWWRVSRFAGMDDGVAHRMERIRATGNGQVPAVARLAWETLAP